MRRKNERGFALLMVYVMAAAIAITLYMEMPRVAFESQRTKEQLLMDRGNQYERAIQVFFRKNKRYPATIDELESYQNVRSLRRRYKDPFTGKDDWRIIHVGPGGVLTDSLIQKPNPLGKDGTTGLTADASLSGVSGVSGPTGASGPVNINGTDGAGLNMALAKRASDRVIGGVPGQVNPALLDGDPNQVQNPPPPQPDPNQYQALNPQNPQNPVGQPPGQLPPGQLPTYPNPVFPNQPYPPNPGQPGNPVYPTQVVQNGAPGQTYPYQQGGQPVPGQPYSYQPNQPKNSLPFDRPPPPPQNAGQNPAISAIQNALFSPRQAPPGIGSTNDIGAGGIAGVATKYKGASIKTVNERHKFQELEFVYDLKKDKSVVGNGAGQMPQNGPPPVNPGFGNGSNPGGGFGSGNSGGIGQGNNSGFGGGQQAVQVNRQP